MKTVSLGGKKAAGRVALVDDEDYDLVAGYRWCLWEPPGKRRPGGPYAAANIKLPDGRCTAILMHKMLTGWRQTDHIDHDGLNNQRSNLRPATQAQNAYNARPTLGTSSQYKGVSWHKTAGKWMAQIAYGRKNRYLGLFLSEEAAAAAYDDAARQLGGEYAFLNFPDVA